MDVIIWGSKVELGGLPERHDLADEFIYEKAGADKLLGIARVLTELASYDDAKRLLSKISSGLVKDRSSGEYQGLCYLLTAYLELEGGSIDRAAEYRDKAFAISTKYKFSDAMLMSIIDFSLLLLKGDYNRAVDSIRRLRAELAARPVAKEDELLRNDFGKWLEFHELYLFLFLRMGEEFSVVEKTLRSIVRGVRSFDIHLRMLADMAELSYRYGSLKGAGRYTREALALADEISASLPRSLVDNWLSHPRIKKMSHINQIVKTFSGEAVRTYSSDLKGRYDALAGLVRHIASGGNDATALTMLLDSALYFCNALRAAVVFRGADGATIRVERAKVGHSFSVSDLEALERMADDVISRGVGFSCSPATSVKSEVPPAHVDLSEGGSLLSLPLRAKGEAIGMLYIDNPMLKSGFSPDAGRFCAVVADIAGIIACRDLQVIHAEEQDSADGTQSDKYVGEGYLDVGMNILKDSDKMKPILDAVKTLSRVDYPVVVTGERGTEREYIARLLHVNSPRKDAPFRVCECRDLTAPKTDGNTFPARLSKFEELFAEADGGTVYLSDIDSLDKAFQDGLLSLLEEGRFTVPATGRSMKIDVRIVASSCSDLKGLVAEGRFSSGLFYKLAGAVVAVPPLRERKEDIQMLCGRFLDKICRELGVPLRLVSKSAMKKLQLYEWPGNLSELYDELMRAAKTSKSRSIGERDLSPFLRELYTFEDLLSVRSYLSEKIERFEKLVILGALRENKYNLQKTAGALGVDRTTLWRKLQKFNISTGS